MIEKFLKRWGWIVFWAMLSVAVAVSIHVLFNQPSTEECGKAVWSAGEILTYISTVALGLLSLWQTQKLHYDNEQTAKYNLAVEKYVLFDFLDIEAVFEHADGSTRNAKKLEDGFNGRKAVWKFNSIGVHEYNKLILKIKIKNISCFPAIIPQIYEKGIKADNCNILCGEQNDRRYIPANEEGKIIMRLNVDDIDKEYALQFHNPFGCTYEQKITISSIGNTRIILVDGASTLSIRAEN